VVLVWQNAVNDLLEGVRPSCSCKDGCCKADPDGTMVSLRRFGPGCEDFVQLALILRAEKMKTGQRRLS
jgi:hypothetical protein